MKNKFLIILIILTSSLQAQVETNTLKKGQPDYYKNEEIISYGKRYRIHNNYLTAGPGFLSSSLRQPIQKALGIDFQFHIKRQHFQIGGFMSGEDFGSNNNLQAHIGYGIRKENKNYNLAFFAGPSYITGVLTVVDTSIYGGIRPVFYSPFGIYACVQCVLKFKYDIGFGGELFAEYSDKQQLFGFKLIAFFSSAYVGPKRNYNPNVRSESQK